MATPVDLFVELLQVVYSAVRRTQEKDYFFNDT